MKNLIFTLLTVLPFYSKAQWNTTYYFNLNEPVFGLGGNSNVFMNTKSNEKLAILANYNALSTTSNYHIFETEYDYEMLFDFNFVSDSVGYACGGGWFTTHRNIILKTINAGQSWETISRDSLGTYQFVFKKIKFINKDTGFVSTESNPEIFRTVDGGNTWTNVSIDSNYGSLIDMQFKNNQGFVAIDYYGEAKSKIFKSDNYGQSWSMIYETTDSNHIGKICIASDNTIYASGTKGLFLKSTNGGLNWQAQNIWPFNFLDAMYFTNEQTGYLNIGGTIHKTTNGGSTWDMQMMNPPAIVNIIQFNKDNSIGYLLAGNTIYKTSNSGGPTSILNPTLKKSFNIYPNPANSQIHLNYNQVIIIERINLFDISGRCIKSFDKNAKTLHIDGIAAGNYLLKIETNKGMLVEKIQKTN